MGRRIAGLYGGRRKAHDVFDDEPGLWSESWNAPASWLQGFVDTGIAMTPELAMTVSAVWAAVTFMARNLGSVPLRLYRRINAKERAPVDDEPLARVLARQANEGHTAIEFWEMAIGYILLRGNAYNEIKEGSRSFADELIPIHPDLVRPERLPSRRIIYRILGTRGNPERIISQEEMFHIRGFMSDGLVGLALTDVAARSLGGVVAADTYAARFFKSGASAALVATTNQPQDDELESELHKSISRYVSGLRNVGGVLVIDEDVTITKVGINPEEAQLLSTREHGVREVARWIGIPTQVLADAGKEPTHASAEVFAPDLVKYSFRPFGVRIEQAVDRDLTVDPDLFAEYWFDAILRGDLKARSAFYQLAVFTGWMNRNEVRMRESMNPGPPELSEYLQPSNMMMAGETVQGSGNVQNAMTIRPGEHVEQMRGLHGMRATIIALKLAERVAARELAKIRTGARTHANSGWGEWLVGFYDKHAEYVSEALCIPISVAREYAARQGMALKDGGIEVAEDWQQTLRPLLAEMALENGRGQCAN